MAVKLRLFCFIDGKITLKMALREIGCEWKDGMKLALEVCMEPA